MTRPMSESERLGSRTRRFWAKVDKRGPCWVWLGNRNSGGYGHFGRRRIMAHRWSLEQSLGRTIAAGLYVLHHCDNPPCVNPAHLYEGTQYDNMRDCAERKRNFAPALRGAAHPRAKLTENEVRYIQSREWEGRMTQRNLARELGVHSSTVGKILYGKHWTHVA